jgi:hypothetical protein
LTATPENDLEAARRAQIRVWDLQSSGAAPNSTEAKAAVNRLMSRIRRLTEADLAAFEAWRASSRT